MAKTFYFYNLEREICVPVENCTSVPVIVQATVKSPGESKIFRTTAEAPMFTTPGTTGSVVPLSVPVRLAIPGLMSSLTVAHSSSTTSPQSATMTITPALTSANDDAQVGQAPRQFDQQDNFWEVNVTAIDGLTTVQLPYPEFDGWSNEPPSFAKDLYPA